MIGYLRGKIGLVGEDRLILDVGGVGYLMQIPASTRTRLPSVGSDFQLFTYLHVREDALTLYGFSDPEEKQLFELLLSVSGVGPKVAVGVLSSVTPETFRRCVLFEDLGVLQKIPGVGKKTAQRMVLDLKDKMGVLPLAAPAAVGMAAVPPAPFESAFSEAIEALSSLGYSRSEAAAALERVRDTADTGPDAGQLVRRALKMLGRHK